jgi:hypothetical protein
MENRALANKNRAPGHRHLALTNSYRPKLSTGVDIDPAVVTHMTLRAAMLIYVSKV